MAVGGVTGEFPAGRLAAEVSLRCFPFTMSARLETPCSVEEGGGGGGGAEGAVDPLARGGKWAGE